MPLPRIEEIEEKLRILRAWVVSLEGENMLLRAKVRAAELSDNSTLVALQIERTGLAKMRQQVNADNKTRKSFPRRLTDSILVRDMSNVDKIKAKWTKLGTGMKRVQEIEAKSEFISNLIPLILYPK
uniref:Uncharacterized protein n=1 Tax=Tanacetum cinerariifolium TaxID=118510 RepID=A0A699IPL1_TANCI|nr:hypothetical protein [Tanacetum cinerariifolium]